MGDSSKDSTDHFMALMLRSVRSALDAILGSPDRVVTLHTLREQFGLKLEDFEGKPAEFHSALVALVGREGAKRIEDRAMRWFYTSLGLEFRPTRTTLPRKVVKARKDYEGVARALKKVPSRSKG